MTPHAIRLAVAAAAVLVTTGCSGPFIGRGSSVDPLESLRGQLENVFTDASFENAFWGVLIRSAETGEVVFARNEHKSFVPASNMKLFTTAAALCKLGPTFRYRTELYGLGPVDEQGILRGPLIVAGSGDPTISGRFNGGRITGTFQAWADSLASRGIRVIDGDLIGDDDFLDDNALGKGWVYEYLTDWYAAQTSGLCFNDNCMDMAIQPGQQVGDPAHVELHPTTAYVTLNNGLKICQHPWEEDWRIFRHQGTNVVDLTGQMALSDEGYEGWFTVHNPTLFAATVLREVLISRGISVQGQARDIDEDEVDKSALAGYRQNGLRLASYTSPSLTDIITVINKRSQNLYAEQLLKTLGALFLDRGSFSSGIEVVKESLREMGLTPDRLIMVDGSGLSRYNLVTPDQVVTLLQHMARHEYFQHYRDSLPIAGVDGTIGHRMRGTPAQGRVWAKTGYVDRVRALSGYVYSQDDEMFIFSMMVNNYTVPTNLAEDVQNRACQMLAGFSRAEAGKLGRKS